MVEALLTSPTPAWVYAWLKFLNFHGKVTPKVLISPLQAVLVFMLDLCLLLGKRLNLHL